MFLGQHAGRVAHLAARAETVFAARRHHVLAGVAYFVLQWRRR